MIKKNIHKKCHVNFKTDITQGESIENKVSRILHNKEPISDGAPEIFQERKEGINPAHDIRTDRWEVALDAMDIANKSKVAKRNYVQNSTDDISKQTKMVDNQSTHDTKPGESPAA